MNIIKKASFRIFQKILYISSFVLSFKEPVLYQGEGSVDTLINDLKNKHLTSVFIVTDQVIESLPFYQHMLKFLSSKGFKYQVFNETKPNPSIQQIEQAYGQYITFNPDAMIAIGGGSSIDLAKGIGVKATHPTKTLQSRKGILKVHKKQPLLIAVPTTAGTGSEATVATVVTDEETHEKYAINDPVLIPTIAVLDPKSCVSLPKHITAATGMDALTHAIEAYLGHSNTKKTKTMAKLAVKGIYNHLLNAYEKGDSLDIRMQMLLASYRAGVAFTRAYVGNIHALAHQLGGLFHVPHGLANAILMPHVLEYYGEKVYKKLNQLYVFIHPEHTNEGITKNGQAMIQWIKDMNQQMGIPRHLEVSFNENDIQTMALRAYQEANPLYPVPVIFDIKDFINLYHLALKKAK